MRGDHNSSSKRLVIIDGKSVFYRGYYAMSNLRTQDGIPTGGVFGFATMALEVIKRLNPDYVAVAWDKPKTNIRKRLALYPEYKAGRKPAPADFYAQIPILHELLDAFGWPLYELDDYEADDIMGALAVQATKKGIETVLITSDMDMLQLVNDSVKVYALKTGLSNIELYSPASFTAKYGIAVDQFLDLKSIKGDSSDNIPGVPGIGEKGAVELLKQYKTLDGVYENIELIKPTLKQKLIDGKKSAYLSRQLAEIWIDAPIKLDLSEVDGSHVKAEELKQLLEKLQFRSLVSKLGDIIPDLPVDNTPVSTMSGVGKNIIINSEEQLKSVKIANSDQLYIHSRSSGKHGSQPKVLILSIDAKTTYTFDLTKLDPSLLVPALSKAKNLVGYDIKNTLKVLLEIGCDKLPNITHDVLIGAFLINSLNKHLDLTDQARSELGYGGSSLEDLDDQEMMTRAAEIVTLISGLYDKQVKELDKLKDIKKLAEDIEWPVIPVLARMEKVGIELDTKYLKKFSSTIEDSISDLEQQIYGYADQEFNIASPSQLADILFEAANLNISTRGIKKTKSGYSTAARELDKLRGIHPIIDLITQYREVTKLKNTYIDTLPRQVDENSRLHTTYSLTTAQTGRLSSLDPNLQNIPTRTDLGRHIRTAFVAGDKKVLVSADYSQFELRLAAVLAKDNEMIEMFNRGADIHTMTAAQVYGRTPEDVTKQMRRAAKVINFGIIYGMSPHGLSAATGMTYEQAQDFITRYKDLRKPLFKYMDGLIELAHKQGYIETMFGRRRLFPEIHSSNYIIRQAAERAAINMPIQGTEADLMKMAMVECEKVLRSQHNDCMMLLQIHDSIVVECPEAVAKSISKLLKETMENVYELPVRLDVDVTIGKNWGLL
jgi:DNA polymerase I